MLDVGWCNRIAEVRQHEKDSIRNLGRDEELSLAPFSSPQEQPNITVISMFNLNRVQVSDNFTMELDRVNE
jgi:hypothetical protein